MRKRVSYANVTSTLALALAVGTGGAFAAAQIDGSQLNNRSVGGVKLKEHTVTAAEVKQSSLQKLVQGGGTLLSGHETSFAGGPPGPSAVIKSIATPLGTFELACRAAAVDARYRNTTAGVADVFRTFVGKETSTFPFLQGVDFDRVPRNGDVGFTASEDNGPMFLDIRAGKGTRAITMRVAERFQAGSCYFDWEFVASK
jgi:hypothetical protein